MVIRSVVLIAAVLLGGWMAFDGVRAAWTGRYVTPSSGDHAGQLGPWAGVVRAAGLDPFSMPVKALFILLGAAWLCAAAGFAMDAGWSRAALALLAVVSLWYLPFGTLFGAVTLVLLLVLRSRGA